MTAMLCYIQQAGGVGAAIALGTKFGGGVAKVNFAIFGHVQIVGIDYGHAVHAVGEGGEHAIWGHAEYAFVGVGYQQVPAGIKYQAQGAALGVDHFGDCAAGFVIFEYPAFAGGGVDFAIEQGQALWAMGVGKLYNLDFGQFVVLLKVAHIALVLRGLPAYGVYGDWP